MNEFMRQVSQGNGHSRRSMFRTNEDASYGQVLGIPDELDLSDDIHEDDKDDPFIVVHEALEKLDPRVRSVMEDSVGMTTGSALRYREIAEKYGYTLAEVKVLQKQGIEELRRLIPRIVGT